MAESKLHIVRGDGTWWTLCGRYLNADKTVESDVGATCRRCLKYYAKRQPLLEGARIAAVAHGNKQVRRHPRVKFSPEAIRDISDKMQDAAAGREIRTTSATGGQKGVKEARVDLVPVGPLLELGILFSRGARKYAEHQWRKGYEWSKAYSALQRHALAWQSGLDYDVCSNDPQGCQHVDAEGNPFTPPAPDTCYNHTGAHHMTAVAWHAFTLLEFKDTHPDHDDRYKIDPFAGFDPNHNAVEIFKE